MSYFDGFKKSTPPQHRRLIVEWYGFKQYVDDFVGDLTFYNHLVDTLCGRKSQGEEPGRMARAALLFNRKYSRLPKLETRNPKYETRNLKSES
jgi:hypothetical protein